jgi:hypothetical protein
MSDKKFIDGRINREHPDLEILAKNCECENTLRSAMGSHKDYNYEGHYFRVRHLRYWDTETMDELKNSFTKTNEQTSEYTFELIDVTDWEKEWDDDRYWEASFTFLAHKK